MTLLLALLAPAQAADLLVPSAAYPTVQQAVNAAAPGDVLILTELVDGPIDVTKDLTFLGVGVDVAVLTANASPVLKVRSGAQVRVAHLTLDGEHARRLVEVLDAGTVATFDDVKLYDALYGQDGGAIYVHTNGTIDLQRSLLCDNEASGGGHEGGGVQSSSTAIVRASHTVFHDQLANADDGGALRIDGSGTLDHVILSNNRANEGSALMVNGGTVDLRGSLILDNESDSNDDAAAYSTGGFTGSDNLWWGNSDGDIEGGYLAFDVQIDPGVDFSGVSCATATMEDFTPASTTALASTDYGAVTADGDGDGWGDTVDCAPTDPSIFPGATELPADGTDQSCNELELCHLDADADGHGSTQTLYSSALDCNAPGLAPVGAPIDDCDDEDPSRHGGAPELVADGIDQDCDGYEACFEDLDLDGFGGPTTTPATDDTCTEPGLAATSEDCDDADGSVFPGGTDTPGDGIDGDCDGYEFCPYDGDGDGFPARNGELTTSTDCPASEGFTTAGPEDCNDAASTVHPGALELCDELDNDCDGSIDNDVVYLNWYPDGDGDGFGDGSGKPSYDCAPPDGYGPAGDCDDDDPRRSPGFPEAPCDGIDNDCDAATPDDDGCVDTGVPADTDTDVDTDSDTDTDTDTDVDTGPGRIAPDVSPTAEEGCACQAAPRTTPLLQLLGVLRRR